jgi:oxepin-CoA hydrolase/3-oxo-5,6-dehydrosuberyl-CoA semialdehyde dehydrogenase
MHGRLDVQCLESYVAGRWQCGNGDGVILYDDGTGMPVARVDSTGLDMSAALDHGRKIGGPVLQNFRFHERALILKEIASQLRVSGPAVANGAGGDFQHDLDAGIEVLLSVASKGRRELPNAYHIIDGDGEVLGGDGPVRRQNVYSTFTGVAVQINNGEFPISLTLGKLGPALLAGMPVIVLPCAAACSVIQPLFGRILDLDLLPEGTLQLVCGSVRGLLDDLTCQDVVAFSGEAEAARKMRNHPAIAKSGARFSAETVDGRCLIAGPDVDAGSPEFAKLVEDLTRDIAERDTQSARRIGSVMVPGALVAPLTSALEPAAIHLLPYEDIGQAISIAMTQKEAGHCTIYSSSQDAVRELVLGIAPAFANISHRDRHSHDLCENPNFGWPDRCQGAGENGIRDVRFYMRRTVIDGPPDVLSKISGAWVPGSARKEGGTHPFRKSLAELEPGDSIVTDTRRIMLADIEHFAEFTGDKFYAHTDERAASANPFFQGRIAHGFLVLSLATGLFVEPGEGPLLANFGVDNLRFLKPVYPGDEIRVALTAKRITPREREPFGEVCWDCSVLRSENEIVAQYDLLTLVAKTQRSSS